jgi:hypothetical protein
MNAFKHGLAGIQKAAADVQACMRGLFAYALQQRYPPCHPEQPKLGQNPRGFLSLDGYKREPAELAYRQPPEIWAGRVVGLSRRRNPFNPSPPDIVDK